MDSRVRSSLELPTFKLGGQPPQARTFCSAEARASSRNLGAVLLVDANVAGHATMAALIRDALGRNCVVECVGDLEVGRALMAQDIHDVYLIELGGRIEDTLNLIRAGSGCGAPIVALVESYERDVDVRALEAGAADCVPKANLSPVVVARSIRQALVRQQIVRRGKHHRALLDQERERLTALQAVSRLRARRACHDIRSPLTVIRCYSSILLSELASCIDVEQAQFLRKIARRVDDVGQIVDNILDCSELASDLVGGRREALSVADLFKALQPDLQQIATASETQLRIRLDEPLPFVFCDRGNIGRVIYSLVAQACKAASPGGTITLWGRYRSKEKSVLIGVTDNLASNSSEHVATEFDPTYRQPRCCAAENDHQNLAMHVVSELVRINLGKLSVTAHPGGGSTSAITLPILDLDRILSGRFGVLESVPRTVPTLSVALATAKSPCCEAGSQEVLQVLWSELRAYDLVIPVQPGHWALCIACHEGDLAKIVRRVSLVFDKANRRDLNNPLPAISLRIVGSWSLGTPSRQVTGAVRRALSASSSRAARYGFSPE